MKIQLLSEGTNKLQTIKLIREYSGLSLSAAKQIAENTPASFICKLGEEMMYEIESRFTEAGVTVIIKPGFAEEKKQDEEIENQEDLIEKVLFDTTNTLTNSNTTTNTSEQQALESKQDIINYLNSRQNMGKAIGAGILSSIILLIVVNIIIWTSFDSVFINSFIFKLIVAVIIGLSIKKAGNGVSTKFGITSALISFILLSLFQFSAILRLIVYSGDYLSISYMIKPSFWGLAFTGIAAFVSFKISYTNIDGNNFDKQKTKLLANVNASEIIAAKRMQMKNTFDNFEKPTYKETSESNKKVSESPKKIVKKRRDAKEKRNSDIIPDSDDEINRFKY